MFGCTVAIGLYLERLYEDVTRNYRFRTTLIKTNQKYLYFPSLYSDYGLGTRSLSIVCILFVLHTGSTPRPTKPTEPEPRSVKSEVAYASDLLIYGESNEVLKDSHRRISKELGELFLGKEIIQLSRVGQLTDKEKDEIYEATKQMSVTLKMNNGNCLKYCKPAFIR